jgi:hypothetical protein
MRILGKMGAVSGVDKISAIAPLSGVDYHGPSDLEITGVAGIEEAAPATESRASRDGRRVELLAALEVQLKSRCGHPATGGEGSVSGKPTSRPSALVFDE